MADATGNGGGVRNRAISPQSETLPLFDSEKPPSTPASAVPSRPAPITLVASRTGKRPHQRIPRWLERAELILRILLRMYIGLAVCYAPWSRVFWDQNPIFTRFPEFAVFAAHGAVRGIVSGVGILNLWIALQDALHHGDK